MRELRDRLHVAAAQHNSGEPRRCADAVFASHADAARQALDDAGRALRCRPARHKRIARWWSGQPVAAAWEAVHRAESELAWICTQEDALAVLPQLRVWMRNVVPDMRALVEYERRFDEAERRQKVDFPLLRSAYRYVIAVNVEFPGSLRAFRNVLFAVAAGLALAVGAVALWHVLHPAFLSLCHSAAHHHTQCFGSGGPKPAGRAVLEVVMVGAVSGLLGAAFVLRRAEGAPGRYNVLVPQIVLKSVAGAATALLGVLLVQSHLFADLRADSTYQLLGYAVLFGFSQELLT